MTRKYVFLPSDEVLAWLVEEHGSFGAVARVLDCSRAQVAKRCKDVGLISDGRRPRRPSVAERFWPRVDRRGPEECWPWLGAVSHGYGVFPFSAEQSAARAHRVAYELLIGEIPDGLTIDHLCRNKLCQNPAHMEPVTGGENTRRAHAAITHCPAGHPYDEANTYRVNSTRYCRACGRARAAARRRAAA
jgi:HNH endonuclease